MPEATNDVVWAWIGTGSPWTLLWLWLALINLMTFLVFGFDKLKAKYKEKHEGARRVPEKTLFLLAALGGSWGDMAPILHCPESPLRYRWCRCGNLPCPR